MAMTFLVVLAGSVVRMTGSGMGCGLAQVFWPDDSAH